jgi:DMSO/TMAO reductase YedYZ molybdopterin-dependent catalytic subunit
LRVEGAVMRTLELTCDQLRELPTRTVTATLECAGNSRALNVPPLRGVAWQQGAVGNAEWTGVPLAAVLERAGLRPAAAEVVLEGADRGEVTSDPRPAGPIPFARSLPLAKARQDEVLLAFRMNGADLPPAHGFPVRAIVPGWYGMASVKWLTRLIVTDAPFQGFWQTTDYSIYERDQGLPVQRPITEMQIKSQIAQPRAGATVTAGSEVQIHGAAWTGESEVNRVEISADAGRTWADARLQGRPQRYAWRLWEYTWRAPANAGRVSLLSRATDARGRTQPATRDPDRRNYMVNHLLPVEVQVR